MSGPQASRAEHAADVSLAEVLAPLFRRWKLLVAIPVGCAVFGGLVSLILPPVYTAQTTITPVTSSSSGGLSGTALASLAGLAGQLGVSGGGGTTVAPEFFAEVLKSRELLTATLESRFKDAEARDAERPLLDIIGIEGKTQPERVSRGVRALAKKIKTRVDRPTGIVILEVKAGDAQLAADVANRMRVILNSFNLERRQSQSREQARFTRERLAEAESELRDAERAELRFLQANREYRGSPLLEFQAGQVKRAVELRQEVYVSLVKAYDEARIAEVRDTPVITTIDSAVAPDVRSSPRPVLNSVIGLLAGAVFALMLVFLLEQRTRAMRFAAPESQGFRQPATAGGRDPLTAKGTGPIEGLS
jgi:uncharacterized protein involved in exopolysaccharide biosynthesis